MRHFKTSKNYKQVEIIASIFFLQVKTLKLFLDGGRRGSLDGSRYISATAIHVPGSGQTKMYLTNRTIAITTPIVSICFTGLLQLAGKFGNCI